MVENIKNVGLTEEETKKLKSVSVEAVFEETRLPSGRRCLSAPQRLCKTYNLKTLYDLYIAEQKRKVISRLDTNTYISKETFDACLAEYNKAVAKALSSPLPDIRAEYTEDDLRKLKSVSVEEVFTGTAIKYNIDYGQRMLDICRSRNLKTLYDLTKIKFGYRAYGLMSRKGFEVCEKQFKRILHETLYRPDAAVPGESHKDEYLRMWNGLSDKSIRATRMRLSGYTFQEIGEEIGITRERARQLVGRMPVKFERIVWLLWEDFKTYIVKRYDKDMSAQTPIVLYTSKHIQGEFRSFIADEAAAEVAIALLIDLYKESVAEDKEQYQSRFGQKVYFTNSGKSKHNKIYKKQNQEEKS